MAPHRSRDQWSWNSAIAAAAEARICISGPLRIPDTEQNTCTYITTVFTNFDPRKVFYKLGI